MHEWLHGLRWVTTQTYVGPTALLQKMPLQSPGEQLQASSRHPNLEARRFPLGPHCRAALCSSRGGPSAATPRASVTSSPRTQQRSGATSDGERSVASDGGFAPLLPSSVPKDTLFHLSWVTGRPSPRRLAAGQARGADDLARRDWRSPHQPRVLPVAHELHAHGPGLLHQAVRRREPVRLGP